MKDAYNEINTGLNSRGLSLSLPQIYADQQRSYLCYSAKKRSVIAIKKIKHCVSKQNNFLWSVMH